MYLRLAEAVAVTVVRHTILPFLRHKKLNIVWNRHDD
jgi:hypothetical protein